MKNFNNAVETKLDIKLQIGYFGRKDMLSRNILLICSVSTFLRLAIYVYQHMLVMFLEIWLHILTDRVGDIHAFICVKGICKDVASYLPCV